MPSVQNTRTLRFTLLTFFTLVVLYKIYTSSYAAKIPLSDVPQIAHDRFQAAKDHLSPPSKGSSSNAAPPPPAANPPSPKDTATTLNSPASLPPAAHAGERANATFVTLARNSDIWEIAKSIRHVEDRFNRKFGYDWVFLNDQPFSEDFIKTTTNLISGKTKYGLIPKEHWSFPPHIDQAKAKKTREDMAAKGVIYGDSISYRHMCRFESGFFFQHELMRDYEFYWRVEPSIELYCDINYDVFKFMKDNNKKYGFTLSLYEYIETISTLWKSTKEFMKQHPEHIAPGNSMKFISDDGENYNRCHFWSNFEVGSLDFWRSQAYTDYFNHLDKDGGFFYERWGDAPVHSIGAALFLPKEAIHFFEDIGYYHVPFTHCPTLKDDRERLKCSCDPGKNFDWKGYSCTSRYFDMKGRPKPKGYENQVN